MSGTDKALPSPPPPRSSSMSASQDAPAIKSVSRTHGLRMTNTRGTSSSGTHGSSEHNGHSGNGNGHHATMSMRSDSAASSTHESSTDHGPSAGNIFTNGSGRKQMMAHFAEHNPPVRTATNTSSQSGSITGKSSRGSKKQHKLNPTRTDYMNERGQMIRPMTNHERYQLVRQNIGRPQAIVHVLPYPAEYIPTRAFFEKRVVELQVRVPRLYARPVDTYTNHPSFEPGDGPYGPEAIMSEGTFIPMPFDHGEEMATILRHEIDGFESLNFADRRQPFWSVRLLTGPEGCTRSYLVAAFNHCIVDSRGALRLLHALTMRSIEALVPEPFETPTRFDDTVKIKPSARYLAPMVFRELVLPKLPKVIQKKLVKEDPWPGATVTRSPLTCGWNISWSALPESTVQQLKLQAKYRGVNNLHSMLKTAYMAAMWRVYGPTSPSPFFAVAGTVIDERQPKLGHAFVSGVYNSVVECELSLTGNERWWNLTGDIAHSITSTRSIADGRMTVGVLSGIPDPEVDQSSPDFDPRTPTGWEKYFVERATSLTPFRTSMATFNIGTTSLPEEALDWIWAQTASPLGPVYYVNFIGHEGGIRMTSSYCDGAAVTKFQTDVVHAMWLRVLERVANGESEKTIADLTR